MKTYLINYGGWPSPTYTMEVRAHDENEARRIFRNTLSYSPLSIIDIKEISG